MTGLEILEGIYKTMLEMSSEIKLIGANIKILNNRIAQLLLSSGNNNSLNVQVEPVKAVVPQQQNRLTQKSNNSLSSNSSNSSTTTRGTLTYKKVYGSLKNVNHNNTVIFFYNKNNEVCASTTIDPIGYWETMLQPGRYSAAFIKDGTEKFNKVFEFNDNVNEFEVK